MLEGGCFVTGLKEGEPESGEGVRIWRHIHRGTGAESISMRVLEFPSGRSGPLRNSRCDEVLYVVEGAGTLILDGRPFDVEPDLAIYVRPGTSFSVLNSSANPLTLVSSQCPDPGPTELRATEGIAPEGSDPAVNPVVRLRDQVSETTGDRWYRVLVDRELGCHQSTQFVGSIPPGRAPDHFHHYEEVLCILAGSGRMWSGDLSAPIQAGSCVFLPRGQIHCVENTGSGELRLLGVFHPAGSPAVRYSADERTGKPPDPHQASSSR
jgi:mannose-6-phosphate isomerase-like protein (cupin superfamily)